MRPADTCDDPVLLAAEVRRLRSVIDSGSPLNLATAVEFQAEIARLQAEIERLRLTDEEREVIRWAARSADAWRNEHAAIPEHLATTALSDADARTTAAMLRGILKRSRETEAR